ncbi:MAG: spore maturation protein A [Ruminococcaceae bacterium]|nr:spore maturation protein A [Oscillospiraceae bacterium]
MAFRISGILMVISFLFALCTGNLPSLAEATVSGCGKAVTVTLSLLGMMCLWGGLMRVAEVTGILKRLERLLRPLLSRIFPDAARSGRGIPEIAAAIVANILGIGNAATPLALRAMERLSEGHRDCASDDMVTFTVLGTAFPSLIPTTVLSLLTAAGSHRAFAILPAVWLTSLCLSLFAVLTARGLRHLKRKDVTPS